MPIAISPIKKQIVKKALKEGKSARKALRAAAYAPSSIHNSTNMTVVKQCIAEIEKEFKLSDITVENVLKNLETMRLMALEKGDYSTATRCEELKGKYLAMFTDKQEVSTVEKENGQFSINRLNRIRSSLEIMSTINQVATSQGNSNNVSPKKDNGSNSI